MSMVTQLSLKSWQTINAFVWESLHPQFSIAKLVQSGAVVELFPEWEILSRYQGQIVAQYPQSRFIPNQLKVLVDFLQSRLTS